MRREDVADLTIFQVVAEERSFTRAAARLGMPQSTLSQAIKRLERRLNVLLVARTTRSVAPTEAGQQLYKTVAPALRDLEQGLARLEAYQARPMGTIRITSVEHAAKAILLPALNRLMLEHPDLNVEIVVDYGLTDVVAGNFDAGVRLGAQVAAGMIAVRISPDIPMSIVGSPEYLQKHGTPTAPDDLLEHRCINLHLPTSNASYPWPLVVDGKPVRVKVDGQATFNAIDLIESAALAGVGLCLLPRDVVAPHVEAGRLVEVLTTFVPPLPAYHLYYSNRRLNSLGFNAVVDALRHRE